MTKSKLKHCFYLYLIIPALSLTACTTAHTSLDSDAHNAMLHDDLTQISQQLTEKSDKTATNTAIEITLEDALHRGALLNLDARVSAMEELAERSDITLEKLAALPSMTASGGITGRSDKGGTSSRSILSGQQSLEPSQSTSETRRTGELTATWNLIDIALAFSDAKTATEETQIAQERHQKVLQNIQRDIYSAYWRALAHQKNEKTANALISQANAQITKIKSASKDGLIPQTKANEKIAQIAAQTRTLTERLSQIATAEIELKSLLSIPLDTKIKLKDSTRTYATRYKKLLSADINDLEWEALKQRPEMREEILKKNIAWRNTRREIISTVPGLELFLSGNYDSNQFLQDPNWGSYTAKITQSLTALITAPARHKKAKNQEFLADARRQALALALMAQTHIARHRLELAQNVYALNKESNAAAAHSAKLAEKQKSSGFSSGEGVLDAQIQNQTSKIESDMAFANLQDSYAAFLNTLGRKINNDEPTILASADKAGQP